MASTLFLAFCEVHGLVKHRRYSSTSKCTRCEIATLDKFRRDRKTKLVAEAGGACVRCGYDKTMNALEFHHRVPAEKEFELSLAGMTKSAERIAVEVAKCDLVCRNCHAELHEEMNNSVG